MKGFEQLTRDEAQDLWEQGGIIYKTYDWQARHEVAKLFAIEHLDFGAGFYELSFNIRESDDCKYGLKLDRTDLKIKYYIDKDELL